MAIGRYLPGVVGLCLGAVLARSIELAGGPNHLLVAIGIGLVVANTVGVPDRLDPGVSTHTRWLSAGIVLMGASITVETIRTVGGRVLFALVAVTACTIVVVEVLSRTVFDLQDRLGSLLAAGAGICGVSAVAAVAGAIRARESQVAYAAATILLFDAVTIAVYPLIGDLLDLPGIVFGVWAGISMFSTGPVVAVGFAHSEVAGQWATMTKLARNALIGVVVVAYATYYARSGEIGTDDADRPGPVGASPPFLRTVWEEFPKFVLGFLALAALASLGAFSPAQRASIEHAYGWLFVIAFVGLGAEIDLAELRRTGVTPALVVLVALVFASALSLSLLLVLV